MKRPATPSKPHSPTRFSHLDEALPSPATLRELSSYMLYNSTGETVPFSSLLHVPASNSTDPPRRLLLIFVRHFLCGNCQSYLIQLTSQLPPSSLPAFTSIAIIGPGAPSLIASYTDITQCPYPIYADPANTLYQRLGMHRTLSLGSKSPDYITQSLLTGAVNSIRQGLQRVRKGDVLRAGDMSVNGGEFLFVREVDGADWTSNEDEWRYSYNVQWCHRMRNSRDHTEIVDLKAVLGVNGGTVPSTTTPMPANVRKTTTTDPARHERSKSLTRRVSQQGRKIIHGVGLKRSGTVNVYPPAYNKPPRESPSMLSSPFADANDSSNENSMDKPKLRTPHLKAGRHPEPLMLKGYDVEKDTPSPITLLQLSPIPGTPLTGRAGEDMKMVVPTAMV